MSVVTGRIQYHGVKLQGGFNLNEFSYREDSVSWIVVTWRIQYQGERIIRENELSGRMYYQEVCLIREGVLLEKMHYHGGCIIRESDHLFSNLFRFSV